MKPVIENDILLDEILSGLKQPQKTLPSKLFYDEKGSELFDEICRLDEYYLTRTELKIMQDNINDIASIIGEDKILVELGSGSSIKIRLLLNHLPSLTAYIPVDISEEHLYKSVHNLKQEYPHLNIIPVVADYTQWFTLPDIIKNSNDVDAYFPGSTIGNFLPEEARKFLKRIKEICGTSSGLLIGVDLQKDKQILLNAYNDEKGITAEFNLNILNHINNLFQSDFDLNNFYHCAVYNYKESRIEMNLISIKNHTINIGGEKINFIRGEKIITEYSYKYTLESFSELVKDIYTVEKVWLDKNKYFSIQFLKAV